MPSFILATGTTLHLVGVCANRTGVECASALSGRNDHGLSEVCQRSREALLKPPEAEVRRAGQHRVLTVQWTVGLATGMHHSAFNMRDVLVDSIFIDLDILLMRIRNSKSKE